MMDTVAVIHRRISANKFDVARLLSEPEIREHEDYEGIGAPVVYVLFDLLWDNGRDLTGKSVVSTPGTVTGAHYSRYWNSSGRLPRKARSGAFPARERERV